MSNRLEMTFGSVTVVRREDYQWGVVDNTGKEIVPFGKYEWIDKFDKGLCRVRTKGKTLCTKNIAGIWTSESFVNDPRAIHEITIKDFQENPDKYAKWGIINEQGEEVLPVEYDEVWNFCGKNRLSTKAVKNGVTTEIYFHDLNPSLPRRTYGQSTYAHADSDYPRRRDGEYEGSYAQDVMGYDDDTIGDAFDGDPDAYWNID